MNEPTGITMVLITGGVRVSWTDTNSGQCRYEVYVSINGGAFIYLTTTQTGIVSYDHMIDKTLSPINLIYRVRARSTYRASAYTNIVSSSPIIFNLTSQGDGSGVALLTFEVSEDTAMILTGTARFYDDAAGTLNEGTSRVITSGDYRTFYLRVPSGTSELKVQKNVITKWGLDNGGDVNKTGWLTPVPVGFTDHPNIDIDVSLLVNCTSLNIYGCNTIHGSINGLNLTYLEIGNGYQTSNYADPFDRPGEGCTITGDVAMQTNINCIDVWDKIHLTGDISALTNLTIIWMQSLSNLTGSIDALANLVMLFSNEYSTLSGSLVNIPNANYIFLQSPTDTVIVPNITALTGICVLRLPLAALTSPNTNQILADVVANMLAPKTRPERIIDLPLCTPTGQGILDKATLNGAGWSVTTL